MPTLDSWYCNGSYLSGWLGCPSGVLTKQEQLDAMRGNFGPAADPNLVNQAVDNFGTYLDQTGYEDQIKKLTAQDSLLYPFGDWISNINWTTVGLVTIGVVGLFTAIGGGSARRYGR